jgi:TRAP-type C4-dicarboxylate transport system substrate-binding protein
MRKLTTVFLAFILVCASASSIAAPVTLKIATAAPETSSWVKAMRASAAEINEKTEGRVTIKYYVGGVQGSDAQVLKKMRIGNLHGGAFTPSALNDIYPDINLYGLPLTFNSHAEAQYVRRCFDERLIEGLAEKGYVTFGFASTGFAKVMSSTPVRSVDDLKGKKVWVPEGDDVSYRAMDALSVSPTALPITDVMVGLQTELLDIVPVSPIGALFLQWYTKVNYVTDLPLVYTFGFMVVDKKMFDRISPEDQAIMHEVMTHTYAKFDKQGPSDNEEALQAILKKGLELIPVSKNEADRIRDTMATANKELAQEGVVSVELYSEMIDHRDAFRLLEASERHDSLHGAEVEISTDGTKGIGAADIAAALWLFDKEVQHVDILLPDGGIRDSGEYTVGVKLHPAIDAEVIVRVIPAG